LSTANALVASKSFAALSSTKERTSAEEQEEILVREVKQKLNALLLYKYQHSKATRELAEVRQALLNLQRHHDGRGKPTPLPRTLKPKAAAMKTYQSSRNRNSTSSGTSSIENKYETIEKSLSPYKKRPGEALDSSLNPFLSPPPSSPSSLLDLGASAAALVDAEGKYFFSSSSCASSSHYAQISPLRGAGLPNTTSPNYFQVSLLHVGHPLRRSFLYEQEITRCNGQHAAHAAQPAAPLNASRKSSSPIRGAISLHRLRSPNSQRCGSSGDLLQMREKEENAFQRYVSKRTPPPPQPTKKTLAARLAASVPASPAKRIYPVYLRPEQNIPEVYAGNKFSPIDDSSTSNKENEVVLRRNDGARISRDDIVVTVRSAKV